MGLSCPGQCTSASLEESDSWESEVPVFFIGKRGVFQGDWLGTRMPVSSSQALRTAISPFVSRVTGYCLIWMGVAEEL